MDIKILQEYKENHLLMCQSHPTLPLLIWNYTPKVTYHKLWDEITLSARALVTDLSGNIISKGYEKFFNEVEGKHEPTDDFEVFEKLDGQYIGVFWYEGEMVVNSKGSFTSIYAQEAKRILETKYSKFVDHFTNIGNSEDFTFVFELIGFEQVVVTYPEPDIVLTGYFTRNMFGYWCDRSVEDVRVRFYNDCGLRVVNRFDGLDWKNIKQLNWKNSEGFVVRFSNGQRCKIKFEDYLKLHRQMTNLTTTGIWEALMEGKPISSILSEVPDEFYDKVQEYELKLRKDYMARRIDCEGDFIRLGERAFDKKTFANLAKDHPHKNILFAIYDKKNYSQMIWKSIKPKSEKL